MAGIYEPQIKKFEDGVRAIRESVPDFSGVTSTATQVPAARPRPTIGMGGTAPAARPRPTIGMGGTAPAARPRSTIGMGGAAPAPAAGLASSAAGAGAQVRRAAGVATNVASNLVAGGALRLGATADAATAPLRAAGEAANNFGRGLGGLPAQPSNPAPFTQQAGQLVQGARAMLSPRPQPNSQTSPATRVRPQRSSGDFSGVTSTVTQAPTAAPAPAAAGASPQFNLQPGDVNTFTGSNGVTRAVPGLQASPAGPTSSALAGATPAIAPRPVVSAAPAARYAARGRQGGIIANPANGSVADQITRAMGSPSLKGSPSGRAAVAQAILQQAGFENEERQSALQTGDQADLASINHQATANEGYATRQLEAQKANLASVDSAADRDVKREEIRIARKPTVTYSKDGSMGIVSNEGGWTPITGANGKTVHGQQSASTTGELTEGDRLKSYDARYAAIAGDNMMLPPAKKEALAQLAADPLYAGLRGGMSGDTPWPEAIALLKSNRGNPQALSDFDALFGPGASTRYLEN